MKHLEEDYELDKPIVGIVSHFFDTIEALGGWTGIFFITISILGFYLFVVFTIQSGRKKREAKKKR